MRVCDVLLSLVTTLIDFGLLANCRRQKDTNKVQTNMSTPPTSSTNIFTSPTKDNVLDSVSNKSREKNSSSQEVKKIEKEVSLEKNLSEKIPNVRNDKDIESGVNGMKEHVGSLGDQGGTKEKTEEKIRDEEDSLSYHNTFMDIVIR